MMILLPKTLLLACFVTTIQAKIFGRCELARLLKNHGMDGFQGVSLANWVCMAFYESGFDSKAVGKSEHGGTNYGIFQINSDWWCNEEDIPSENLCYVPCTNLLNSDIEDDILCAKRIVEDPEGMKAWEEWRINCENENVTHWVAGCEL